jgi:hypothetical protein
VSLKLPRVNGTTPSKSTAGERLLAVLFSRRVYGDTPSIEYPLVLTSYEEDRVHLAALLSLSTVLLQLREG